MDTDTMCDLLRQRNLAAVVAHMTLIDSEVHAYRLGKGMASFANAMAAIKKYYFELSKACSTLEWAMGNRVEGGIPAGDRQTLHSTPYTKKAPEVPRTATCGNDKTMVFIIAKHRATSIS